jgi:hypothetical protein
MPFPGARQSLAAAVALVLLSVRPAAAVDGVRELSQATVSVWPIVISAPGSYVLTTDLTVANFLTSAIRVDVDRVTIDLNGRTISGPYSCTGTGAALTCSQPTHTQGWGIDATNRALVTVRNGRIRGFAAGGINGGDDLRVEGVTVLSNQGYGIRSSTQPDAATVTGCAVVRNGAYGLYLGEHSLVESSRVIGNFQYGIFTLGAGLVRGNTINRNGSAPVTNICCAAVVGYAENMFGYNGGNPSGIDLGQNACLGTFCP